MAEIENQDRTPAKSAGDARELQARLYREVGLLAVAAALDVRLEGPAQPALQDGAAAPRERRAA